MANQKLTATLWKDSAKRKDSSGRNDPDSRLHGCDFVAGAGGHPVEWLGGNCLTLELVRRLRTAGKPETPTMLFARKFAATTLPKLSAISFLDL